MIAAGFLLLLLLTVLLPRGGNVSGPGRQEMTVVVENYRPLINAAVGINPPKVSKAASTPEEIVAEKVSQFARSRREIAFGLARKHQTEMPAEVEQFFDAVEAGNWELLSSLFESIQAKHRGKPSARR